MSPSGAIYVSIPIDFEQDCIEPIIITQIGEFPDILPVIPDLIGNIVFFLIGKQPQINTIPWFKTSHHFLDSRLRGE